MELYRRHFRHREPLKVAWKLMDHDEISGQGIIVNISVSGLLLQAQGPFQLFDDAVLSLESTDIQPLPFASKKGKIMWFRRIHTPQERFQCGVEFLPDEKDSLLKDWMDKKMDVLSEVGDAKILEHMIT